MCSCVCMLMGINLRWKYAGNFLTYKYKRWSASKSIKTHFFYLPFFFISISFLFFSDSLWFVKTFPFSCALNVWSTSYCQWASSCLLIRRQTEKKNFFEIISYQNFIQIYSNVTAFPFNSPYSEYVQTNAHLYQK